MWFFSPNALKWLVKMYVMGFYIWYNNVDDQSRKQLGLQQMSECRYSKDLIVIINHCHIIRSLVIICNDMITTKVIGVRSNWVDFKCQSEDGKYSTLDKSNVLFWDMFHSNALNFSSALCFTALAPYIIIIEVLYVLGALCSKVKIVQSIAEVVAFNALQ